MIVLHLSNHPNGYYLWAEKTPEHPLSTPPRKSEKSAVPAHPFEAGVQGLKEALRSIGSGVKVSKQNTEMVCAWLPSKGGLPLASAPFLLAPPESKAKIVIAPWIVTARPLTFSEVCDLLAHCAERPVLARGVVAGADVRWFAEAMRASMAFLNRQCYLPGVREEAGAIRARWVLVLDDAGREHVLKLAGRMPGACRCLSEEGVSSPRDGSPRAVAEQFIADAVDSFVSEANAPQLVSTRKRKASFDSVHDAWLEALCSPDATIQWQDRTQLKELAQQIRQWRRPLRLSTHADYRLVFRLDEPRGDDGVGSVGPMHSWYVNYLLQPKDDLSLLLPVADLWRPRTRSARWLKKHGGNPQEYLLAALGQAAGLCPEVGDSLAQKQPEGFSLDTPGAHRFLTANAAVLESAGFGVLLPSWWTRRGPRKELSVRLHVKSPQTQAAAGLSALTVCEFDYELALGGERLSIEELEALAALKTPLVKLRGAWVELSPEQIRAAAAFWEQHPSGRSTVGDIVRTALGGDEIDGLPVEGVQAVGRVGGLLKQLVGESQFQELASPETFAGALRPYQQRGYSWLTFLRQWGLGACLADDMGLGKTIQTLALLQRERERGETRPVLLICPTSVVSNWRREAERFAPNLPVLIHHGTDRRRQRAFREAAMEHALVVSSYGLLQRDSELLKDVPWAGIVLDEAQNVKNPETKQSRAARSLSADYRIALTGTPVENHVGDLWAIMEFLNPGLLGSQAEFKEQFLKPIQLGGGTEAAERLKRLTGPFILRRLKTDKVVISDLPEKMEMKTYCTLTKEQASLYAAVLKEVEESLDGAEGIQRKGLILSTLSRLKQICNHPAHFLGDNSAIDGRSGKLSRLVEMLEEVIESGDRSLIFTQYAEMGSILQRYLQEAFGQEVLFLHGGVPRKHRDRMVERFQKEGPAPSIFVLSLKAGGTGLNLTRANQVFHFDRWWNPAVENQATDRAFRIGQTRNVQVRKMICAGTLEERIDELIERKTAVAETVVGTGEQGLTELSNSDLKKIIALSREAVGDQL
jgi:SNF2 family DNA or RNA helicase